MESIISKHPLKHKLEGTTFCLQSSPENDALLSGYQIQGEMEARRNRTSYNGSSIPQMSELKSVVKHLLTYWHPEAERKMEGLSRCQSN